MTQDGQPAATGNNNGAPVARDPDAIVVEIEQTRAELADTIDKIADRVNPKHAASRGIASLKATLEGLKSGERPSASVTAAAATAVVVGVTAVFLLRRRSR